MRYDSFETLQPDVLFQDIWILKTADHQGSMLWDNQTCNSSLNCVSYKAGNSKYSFLMARLMWQKHKNKTKLPKPNNQKTTNLKQL